MKIEKNKEDFTLKKIRYYQATIDDYATFWEKKIAESSSEESEEHKSLKQKNEDLNKSFEIVPVTED